mgnify:CR=1 FL=1
MYCTGYNLKLGNKHFKETKLKGIPDNYRGLIKNYFESNLFNSIVNSSVVLIPKYIFDEIGLFDINMKSGQDTYLWTQIAVKYKVAIHNITTATVLRNDNSLSNSMETFSLKMARWFNKESDHLSEEIERLEKDQKRLKKQAELIARQMSQPVEQEEKEITRRAKLNIEPPSRSLDKDLRKKKRLA